MPKWQPWTLERGFTLAGALGGIAALFISFFHLEKSDEHLLSLILIYELIFSVVILSTILIVQNKRRLRRYSQIVFYWHFINHVVRDEFASVDAGETAKLDLLLQDVVDAAAHCFSILIGRRCRCSIKELISDNTLKTVVRDRISSVQISDTSGKPHKLEENTDFDDLWYGRNGHTRYYLEQDIVAIWRSGNYKNSSFQVYGQPEAINLWSLSFVKRWPLPYKSTIVWPIRYIPHGCQWPDLSDHRKRVGETSRPTIFGFLCIDCRSRNVFDDILHPEIGAAIADILYAAINGFELRKARVNHMPAFNAKPA